MSRYAFNAFPLFRRAAKGDVDAMRELAEKGSKAAWEAESEPSMIVALTFARLAYYASGEKEDAGRLIYQLAMASQMFGPCELQDEARAEAIAVIDVFDGDDVLTGSLCALIDDTPADVVALAQTVSQMMKEDA